MRRRWFGSHWGDRLLLMGNHTTTPVGQLCVKCHRPIRASDQGWLVADDAGDVQAHAFLPGGPMHLECAEAPIRGLACDERSVGEERS